jgi:hypothetical protein
VKRKESSFMSMFIGQVKSNPDNEDILTMLLQDEGSFSLVDFNIIRYGRNDSDRVDK